jgi:hypothetical protein
MTPQEAVDRVVTAEQLHVSGSPAVGGVIEIVADSLHVLIDVTGLGFAKQVSGGPLPEVTDWCDLGVLECKRITNEVKRRSNAS